MVRASRILLVASLSLITVLTAQAAQTHLPTPSTWKLNLAETDFGGGQAVKSEVFVTIVDSSKWMTFTDELTDANGKVWKATWTGPTDGTMHPMSPDSGEQLGDNAAKDVEVITSADGSTQTCNFFLSPDKKKFSEKCLTVAKNGKKSSQFLVYDRIK